MNIAPSLLRRSFAKLIDYLALISGAIFLASTLSFAITSISFLILVFSVSFIWIPFDILLQKCFKTTPGQFLVGITSDKRQKWGTLLQSATVASIKSFSIFIPLFNLMAVWFLTAKEPKAPSYLIKRKGWILPRVMGYILFFGIVGYSSLELELDNESSKSTHLVAVQMSHHLNWKEFNDPSTDWQAKFPKAPKERDFTLQLPDKEVPEVEVTEHFHKDENKSIEYTISSIELDQSLLHWGYKRVLKGSLEIVADNIANCKVISKTVIQFNDNPAIHYYIQDGDNQRMGRLILVGNTLYRVETTYSPEKHDEIEQELFNFLNSFEI